MADIVSLMKDHFVPGKDPDELNKKNAKKRAKAMRGIKNADKALKQAMDRKKKAEELLAKAHAKKTAKTQSIDTTSIPYVPEYTIPSTYIKSVIKTKKSKRKNKTTKNKKGGGKNRKYFTIRKY